MSDHQYQLTVQFGSGKATTTIQVSRALTQTERDEISRDIVKNMEDNLTEYFWHNFAIGAKKV